MKKKILILLWHPTDSIAGGFVRVKELLPYLSEEFEITVLDNYPSLVDDSRVKVVTYRTPEIFKFFYRIHHSLGRIIEWGWATVSLIVLGSLELRREGIKVIYGPTGDNPHIFISGIILKKLFPEKKLLLDILNLEVPEGGVRSYFSNFRKNGIGLTESAITTFSLTILIWIERKLVRICDFVVTVSPYMSNIISRYFPKNKIDFTPSGVTVPRDLDFGTKKRFNGIYFGRQTKDKGIFDVINVWKIVSEHSPRKKLITAGSLDNNVKKLLEKKILNEELKNNVKIMGKVDEGEKWNLLLQSKYFLHLAYFEPLVPVITILEALGCGLPVIMYDTGAIDDYPLFRKNPAIFIVKNQDLKEAVQAILYLEDLPKKEIEKIAVEAKKIARKFSWDKIAEKEINIIKNL